MQFLLDKSQKISLYEQAREQVITALHMGRLRSGDRLPSVRQVALRNNINIKTVFSIYQRLEEDGYIELRTGSGAYVLDKERVDHEQAYCLSIFRLIKSNLLQASHLKIEPRQYSNLVQNFVEKSRLGAAHLAIIECNEEQVNLFAAEISNRLNIRAHAVLISRLQQPDSWTERLLSRMDYFATTDYHYKQVLDLVAGYKKKTLQLRLKPEFLADLISAAKHGRVLMVVSNTSFFSAFRQRLINIGIPRSVINQISAVDDTNLNRLRARLARVRSVYISPICNPQVRNLLPDRIEELKMVPMLSRESIDALEAMILFHIQ